MKFTRKTLWTVIRIASKEWVSKDPFRESAVIAYYTIFSLPGLLVIMITLAGYVVGKDEASRKILGQISSTLGTDTAIQIQGIITKANEGGNSVIATTMGIITILVGATGVFAEFQTSLNTIWHVKTKKSASGIWNIIKARLFSFGLILSIAFMLIVSLMISALMAAFSNWLTGNFSDTFIITMQIVNMALSLGILTVLFALMFKILPDAQITWEHVWIGSVVTALLFELGKFALGIYFGKINPTMGYGTAGSMILILLWVSYSSMIVFFGAEFTYAYARVFSGKVKPTAIAIAEDVIG
jgi:membrane protein